MYWTDVRMELVPFVPQRPHILSGIVIVLAAVVAAEYWIWGDFTAACASMTCARHVARLQDLPLLSCKIIQVKRCVYLYIIIYIYIYITCERTKEKRKSKHASKEARRKGKKEKKERERRERERCRVIISNICTHVGHTSQVHLRLERVRQLLVIGHHWTWVSLDQGYDQLVGKSSRDVHAHVARRPKVVSAPKAPEPRDTWDRRTPMNPQQVPKVTPRETPREIREERSERSERSAKVRPPPSVPSAAPTASVTSSPSAPSAPSAPSKPRPADPNAAPEKPPYILRLEESARAFARVNREKRRKQGPASARQKVHGGVQSGASIGSASTASTTPESVRKRLLAGSEAGYHGHGGHLLLEHGTDLRDLQCL